MQSLVATETRSDQKLIELGNEIDSFTRFPRGYSMRVAELAGRIGTSIGLGQDDSDILRQAALIRDIGELRMEREYIWSARSLAADERLDLRRHPVIGEQEAARLGLGRAVQLMIRWHHEWFSGRGYPDRLRGEEIPLKARILRVADAFSALTNPRPFREPHTADNAKRYLIEWAGIEFDPLVVKTFLSLADSSQGGENV